MSNYVIGMRAFAWAHLSAGINVLPRFDDLRPSGICTAILKDRDRRLRVRMDYRLYDMSEPHSDIGVTLWGPGQALFKASMATVSSITTLELLW